MAKPTRAMPLGVLPSVGLGLVASQSREAEAVGGVLDVGEIGVDLVWAVVAIGWAGEETALPGEDVVAVVGVLLGPAVGDGALGHAGGVSLGVADGTALGVDVDELTAWDDGAHGKASVTTSEVGVLGVGAAALLLDLVRAVVSRWLA